MRRKVFQYDDRSGQVANGPFEESQQRYARPITDTIKTILHRGERRNGASAASPKHTQ